MTQFADHTTLVADILGTEIVNGEPRAKLGYWEGPQDESKGISNSSPIWSSFGFASRPADPDALGACMAVYTTDGNDIRIQNTRDLRTSGRLPDVKPGETLVYSYAGTFSRYHQDGRWTTMCTDDNTPEGRAIYLQISPTNGLIFESPWARLTAGPLGIHLVHKSSGARLDMNSLGGLPSPLSALAAMVQLSSPGILKLEGAAIALGGGTTPGLANEVSVIALQSWLTAMNVLLAALKVFVTAVVVPTGVPDAATKTTLNAAIDVLIAATTTANAAVTNIGKPI